MFPGVSDLLSYPSIASSTSDARKVRPHFAALALEAMTIYASLRFEDLFAVRKISAKAAIAPSMTIHTLANPFGDMLQSRLTLSGDAFERF
jgi:hypothetical protein